MTVVAFPVLREIHHDGIIEHGPLSFGSRFEFLNDLRDLIHVADADLLTNLIRRNSAVSSVVTQLMNGNVIPFIAGHPFDRSRQFIDSVGHDIGQTGHKGGNENIGHGLLLFGRAGIRTTIGMDGIDLRQVLRNGIRHFLQLLIPGADRFNGRDVIA